MPPHAVAETIETQGCRVVLRRVEGPEARELFLLGRPPVDAADAAGQAEAVYRAILDVLAAEGGSFDSVVWETLFLRSLGADLERVRAARQRALASDGAHSTARAATTEIEQPPLDERARLEVSLHAVLPKAAPLRAESVEARPVCDCPGCARSRGLRIHVGDDVQLHAGGLYGRGEDAHAQTLAMFAVAEDLLARAGLSFRDVVRTWIHLREMERDYADMNRARRAFFAARGIAPAPASTGIGGGPVPGGHDLCLALYALRAAGPPARTVMTAPTLNEAPEYGSDFARGLKVVEANKVALHVSGTASIDEAGRTVHAGDFEAQADRMLLNVAALLEGQGACFADVVSAITYLKRPADAPRLRQKLREAGFEGFPHALVAAPICRPELLCETEALAVLPRTSRPSPSGSWPARRAESDTEREGTP